MGEGAAGPDVVGDAGRAGGGLRRWLGRLAVALGLVALAACAPPTVQPPPSGAQPAPSPGTQTDALGRPLDPGVTRVALLVPITGRGSEIAPALQNAAEMALFDLSPRNVELMPRDTGGTPQGAARAASQAVSEGADLILGPLFAENAVAAGRAVQGSGVNVVSFSTDATVAGGNVFVMGILPSTQIDRVVSYARNQGIARYAVLAPANEYGNITLTAMRAAAGRAGAQIVATQMYDPNAGDFSGPVQAIEASGAEAVMIPDGGLRLRQVASLVPYYGMTGMQMVGTMLWDDPSLQVERALHGGWFAAPDPSLRRDFEARYEANFGAAPPRLATLAYDGMALAIALGTTPSGTGGSGFSRTALTDPSGFAGLDGIFRFGQNGQVERGLAVLEMTSQGPQVVEPAPQSFAGAAF
jgi:ABC-type branched-subunit amino acid transport system substrate-binding protein